jgi:hypothetical protein
MIRNRESYDRMTEHERHEALVRMTAADSIAIGEALLTSDLMRLAVFPDDDQPRSLAHALGIGPAGAPRRVVGDHGPQ